MENESVDNEEVREDFEEFVDESEHEAARDFERKKKLEDERDRLRHEDFVDEYRYGEESGEDYEKPE